MITGGVLSPKIKTSKYKIIKKKVGQRELQVWEGGGRPFNDCHHEFHVPIKLGKWGSRGWAAKGRGGVRGIVSWV